jgi:hypothetical protein
LRDLNKCLTGFTILLHLNMSLVRDGDEMKVGDLVKHVAMSDDCITPGLVVRRTAGTAYIEVAVLWAGDTVLTYCNKENLEVISENR